MDFFATLGNERGACAGRMRLAGGLAMALLALTFASAARASDPGATLLDEGIAVAGEGGGESVVPEQGPVEAPSAEPSSSDLQAQVSAQESDAEQAAGAQAESIQVQPVNVFIPIYVDSPGSDSVVDQAIGSSAEAGALNWNEATQSAGQTQAPSEEAVLPAQEPAAPDNAPQWAASVGASQSPPGEAAAEAAAVELEAGGVIALAEAPLVYIAGPLVAIQNWSVTWELTVEASSVFEQVESMVEEGSTSTAPDDRSPPPKLAKSDSEGARAGVPSPSARPAESAGPAIELARGTRVDPALGREGAALKETPALGALTPRHAAPGSSSAGAGSPSTGILLAGFVALGLQLALIAFAVGRRLRLARLAWRPKACISPLERPG